MLKGLFGRDRRDVFRFRAGGKWQHRDPAVIRRRLNELLPDWSKFVAQATLAGSPRSESDGGPAEDVYAAIGKLAEVTASAFDVPPLATDGTGMTEAERIELLADYLEWCGVTIRAGR